MMHLTTNHSCFWRKRWLEWMQMKRNQSQHIIHNVGIVCPDDWTLERRNMGFNCARLSHKDYFLMNDNCDSFIPNIGTPASDESSIAKPTVMDVFVEPGTVCDTIVGFENKLRPGIAVVHCQMETKTVMIRRLENERVELLRASSHSHSHSHSQFGSRSGSLRRVPLLCDRMEYDCCTVGILFPALFRWLAKIMFRCNILPRHRLSHRYRRTGENRFRDLCVNRLSGTGDRLVKLKGDSLQSLESKLRVCPLSGHTNQCIAFRPNTLQNFNLPDGIKQPTMNGDVCEMGFYSPLK
jgi:hypothetical protein